MTTAIITVECDNCDGVGWTEGGETLQTMCPICKGTGKLNYIEDDSGNSQ